MKRLFDLLIILVFIGSARAEITKLPEEARSVIFKTLTGDSMVRITAVKDIPLAVMQACSDKRTDFKLADPGQKFQVTDVITERGLLSRRLVWAARIPGYYIIHHELGGVGHSYHILIVAYSSTATTSAKLVWSAGAIRLSSYEDFLETLSGRALDDRFEYGY